MSINESDIALNLQDNIMSQLLEQFIVQNIANDRFVRLVFALIKKRRGIISN